MLEMFIQICKDYRSLPDPRTLTTSDIKFFYRGSVGELKQATKTGGA